VISGQSDTCITLYAFHEDALTFDVIGVLVQDCTVLALASFFIPPRDSTCDRHVMLLSTGTNGYVHLWDITRPNDSQSRAIPVHSMRAHQSGVNCVRVVPLSDYAFMLLTGGDDQCIYITTFECHPAPCCEISNVITTTHVTHHNAAIKGIWTDGHVVLACGQDQLLSCWHVDRTQGTLQLKHVEDHVVEVSMVLGLDVVRIHEGCLLVAVAGHGLQTLTVHL